MALRVLLRCEDFLCLLNSARDAARDDDAASKSWPAIPINDEHLVFDMWRVTHVTRAGRATFTDFRDRNKPTPGLIWRLVMTEFNTDFTVRAARVGMPTGPRSKGWSWATTLGHFIDAVKQEQFRRWDCQKDFCNDKQHLPTNYFSSKADKRRGNDERPFKSPEMVPFVIWIADRSAAAAGPAPARGEPGPEDRRRSVRHRGAGGGSTSGRGADNVAPPPMPSGPSPGPWGPSPWVPWVPSPWGLSPWGPSAWQHPSSREAT